MILKLLQDFFVGCDDIVQVLKNLGRDFAGTFVMKDLGESLSVGVMANLIKSSSRPSVPL